MEIWSFFAGGMGLDLGLEQAGLAPTLANEINPVFCNTIRRNRPGLTLVKGDIRELKLDDLRRARKLGRSKPDIYLFVGGPPCQSFSSGGKRAGLTDPRGSLIYEYLRLIDEARPAYFVLENVANLATAALRHRPILERPGQHWSLKSYDTRWQNGDDQFSPLEADELASSALRQILKQVGKLRYSIRFAVLDSADYGAPQHRLRFVMYGARDGDCPTLPAPTHGSKGAGIQPYTTVFDAIWDLRHDPGPHSEYTPEVRRIFEQVPEGGNWRSLPPKLQMLALGKSFHAGGGKTGFYRRLSWSRPAPTITGRANRKASAMCHPKFHRPLSVRECAALQGFPDGWFEGSMNSQYLQIGNAVPVHLGRAIGKSLIEHQKKPNRQSVSLNVEDMLSASVSRLRAAACNKRTVLRRALESEQLLV